jgi:DNA-binding Lrp family transcriptional regulator
MVIYFNKLIAINCLVVKSRYTKIKKGNFMNLEELDKELLYKMQSEFPLVPKPFQELAKSFNVSEELVLNRVKELKDKKILRQTSAIFDTKRLGYKSSLVAFKVDSKDIDKAVKLLTLTLELAIIT